MARFKKLCRDELLDAALSVILEKGPHALTFGNIATAAGVTKGGIQSNFGTKEAIINALFNRWAIALDQKCADIAAETGQAPDSFEVFQAATLASHLENPRRDAAMFILMSLDEKQRQSSKEWARQKFEQFGLDQPEAHSKRLFFAVHQALIIVKSIGLMPISAKEWQKIFDETDHLIER